MATPGYVITCERTLVPAGGNGAEGIVEDILSYGIQAADRNAARVKWSNGFTEKYRLGYAGMVDLVCTEEAPGPMFYPKHLAVLGNDIVFACSNI